MLNIPKTSINEVEKYLKLWDSLENYKLQEDALNKLFFDLYPNNDDISGILLKCSTLNDFYSTNIFSIAKHIKTLNIDKRLRNFDNTLVDDIANVTISEKNKYFYSFATKYCSHHCPTEYPIYDYYVERILMHFKKKDNFYNFKLDDLKKYDKFKKILIAFKKYYGIDNYSLKDIDRYLWQLGKEFFPRKYKKL